MNDQICMLGYVSTVSYVHFHFIMLHKAPMVKSNGQQAVGVAVNFNVLQHPILKE